MGIPQKLKAGDIEEPSISFPFLLAACESQGGRKSSGVKHNIGGFPLLWQHKREHNKAETQTKAEPIVWQECTVERGERRVVAGKRMGVGVSADDKETLGWAITDRAGSTLTEGTTRLWGSCSTIPTSSSSSSTGLVQPVWSRICNSWWLEHAQKDKAQENHAPVQPSPSSFPSILGQQNIGQFSFEPKIVRQNIFSDQISLWKKNWTTFFGDYGHLNPLPHWGYNVQYAGAGSENLCRLIQLGAWGRSLPTTLTSSSLP